MIRPSSREVTAALARAGFEARPAKGSHQAWQKKVGDRTRTVVVVLGKKEIPAGTMRSILNQWGISEEEYSEI